MNVPQKDIDDIMKSLVLCQEIHILLGPAFRKAIEKGYELGYERAIQDSKH